MKKILALILVICMLTLTFVACGEDPAKDTDTDTEAPVTDTEAPVTEAPPTETEPKSESEAETAPPAIETAKLKVGFAKVDITPDYSVPLAGDSSRRMSEGVNDNIYTTVIVFEDGDGNRALLMTADLLHLTEEENVYNSLLRRLKKLGFDEENVILSATHTHSAPEIYRGWLSTTYNVEFYKKVLEAAEAAVADLSETDIYIGTKDVSASKLTFTRRYYDANGDFVGVNWPNNNPPVAHEGEADSEMVATKFVREGKKDIVLVNWGAHPTGMSGEKNKYISADYIGYMRDYAEDMLKCDFAFFQAASGNTVTNSKISELSNGYDTENYGKQLGLQLGLVLKKMTQINSNVSVKTNMENLTIYKNNDPANKPENIDELIKIATEFLEGKINSAEALTRSRAAGVSSVYEAMKYRSLYGINKDVTESNLRFVTINVGGLTFASAPFEMFCENGKNIKERSEAELTFIVTHANGGYGYIPTAEAIEKGGYEVATFTYLPDTAEKIENKIVELINKHYK